MCRLARAERRECGAIVPAIGGYGAGDIYLGEFSPQAPSPSQDMFLRFRASFRASGSAT